MGLQVRFDYQSTLTSSMDSKSGLKIYHWVGTRTSHTSMFIIFYPHSYSSSYLSLFHPSAVYPSPSLSVLCCKCFFCFECGDSRCLFYGEKELAECVYHYHLQKTRVGGMGKGQVKDTAISSWDHNQKNNLSPRFLGRRVRTSQAYITNIRIRACSGIFQWNDSILYC